MTLSLNPDTNRWELRDGARVLLSFAWDGECYRTDRGEDLGRVWDAAKKQAENLAAERMRAEERKAARR